MPRLKTIILSVLVRLEELFDKVKYNLKERLGWKGLHIHPYRGHGTSKVLYLKGRVLKDKGIGPVSETDSAWSNLLKMFKRLESDEVPNARVLACFQNKRQRVRADSEGYFDVVIKPSAPLNNGYLWYNIDLELLRPVSKDKRRVQSTGEILVPPPTAEFAVISDIDDTIMHSNVLNKIRMLYLVFLKNAHTRLPFKGVGRFYRALHEGKKGGARNPIFYVSSSPWNLYDALVDFFEFHHLPVGPLFLRDIGLTKFFLFGKSHQEHKTGQIQFLLDCYPHLQFILIGDNGEKDPEIYAELASQNPTRILAIYIRKINKTAMRAETIGKLTRQVQESGSPMLVVDDTLAAAHHAAKHGWIKPGTVPSIREGQVHTKDMAGRR